MGDRAPRLAMRSMLLPLLCLPLGACLVRTAADVVTAPVRAASWGVDKATTSQSEADRNRGRRERKQEEREAKARAKAEKQARRDRDGG